MAKIKQNYRFMKGLAIVVLFALGAWSFYNIIYQFVGDVLLKYNITNVYYQNGIILGIILIILVIIGFSAKSTIKKIVG